mmetsp:Transcript_34225/g.55889  ORF Transcript_34225/g.55889 Transcript_34225/m.55889 type:complete len:229 (+) Transcript_34225:603-1289(+)
MHLDARLFCFSGIAQLAPPAPVRHRGIVQQRLRRPLHGPTLFRRQKVLNHVNPRRRTIDHDLHLVPPIVILPVLHPLRLRGIQTLIGTRVILHQRRHVLADRGLKGDFFVGAFDFDGDALLDAGGERVEDGGGEGGAWGDGGELGLGGGFAVVEEGGGGFGGDGFGIGVFYFYAISDYDDLILILIHRKMIHPTSLILPRTNPRLLRRQFPNLEHVSRERIQCKVRPV